MRRCRVVALLFPVLAPLGIIYQLLVPTIDLGIFERADLDSTDAQDSGKPELENWKDDGVLGGVLLKPVEQESSEWGIDLRADTLLAPEDQHIQDRLDAHRLGELAALLNPLSQVHDRQEFVPFNTDRAIEQRESNPRSDIAVLQRLPHYLDRHRDPIKVEKVAGRGFGVSDPLSYHGEDHVRFGIEAGLGVRV